MNALTAAFASEIVGGAGNNLLDHSRRVAHAVARVLQLEPDLANGLSRDEIVLAALLHDLGKVMWPREYFSVPLRLLADSDRQAMQSHPLVGADLAWRIGTPEGVVALIEQHHERPGGTGYPRRISNPHPAALLIGACDAFVACLEPRPYRSKPLSRDEALREAAKVGLDAAVKALEKEHRTGGFRLETCRTQVG